MLRLSEIIPGGSGALVTPEDLAIKVSSNPSGIAGADQVTNMVALTQAEYDAIVTKNASTIYVIAG